MLQLLDPCGDRLFPGALCGFTAVLYAKVSKAFLAIGILPQLMENSKAAVGYDFCSRLFEIEREMEELSSEDRQLQRQLRSKPIVKEYYAWLDTLFQPGGKPKQAVTYAVNQKPYLCAFLEHGEIEISNNQVENAIRPMVVGRKNWLFSDTPQGAEASAIAFSLIETAKANGLNIERFLLHILKTCPHKRLRSVEMLEILTIVSSEETEIS